MNDILKKKIFSSLPRNNFASISISFTSVYDIFGKIVHPVKFERLTAVMTTPWYTFDQFCDLYTFVEALASLV